MNDSTNPWTMGEPNRDPDSMPSSPHSMAFLLIIFEGMGSRFGQEEQEGRPYGSHQDSRMTNPADDRHIEQGWVAGWPPLPNGSSLRTACTEYTNHIRLRAHTLHDPSTYPLLPNDVCWPIVAPPGPGSTVLGEPTYRLDGDSRSHPPVNMSRTKQAHCRDPMRPALARLPPRAGSGRAGVTRQDSASAEAG